MKKRILLRKTTLFKATIGSIGMLFCILGYFILENFNIIITIVVGIVGAIYIFVEFSIYFMFIEFTEEYLKIYDYKKKFLLKVIFG